MEIGGNPKIREIADPDGTFWKMVEEEAERLVSTVRETFRGSTRSQGLYHADGEGVSVILEIYMTWGGSRVFWIRAYRRSHDPEPHLRVQEWVTGC